MTAAALIARRKQARMRAVLGALRKVHHEHPDLWVHARAYRYLGHPTSWGTLFTVESSGGAHGPLGYHRVTGPLAHLELDQAVAPLGVATAFLDGLIRKYQAEMASRRAERHAVTDAN